MTDADFADLIIGSDGLARPAWAATTDLLRDYYDTEWGMPVRTEQGLFERLCLESFQAGLSWELVLRKREGFRRAFAGFDPEKVAEFDEGDVEKLMANPEIIRNQRKIRAVLNNARATLTLRGRGGLSELIWSHQPAENLYPRTSAEVPSQSPESLALSKALKEAGFTFVGPTMIFALMEAVGMVDTHLLESHRRGSSGVWA
ncbi:DNA-3-methyladenine glycosylase I [Corynebacterium comes]|uniref:DNA-3-methyladenine glycosylase 1 n=1 Tax=Corynebacterium comes TaxID=2675218 RepID=A0A6B8VLV2_9CORY|nr:DNA-3-methyladenine glycosylase I [Corynebacterium comes]QGU04049.1 DNA-3-methyladenine glycosylase 1 [Corynebacterium comes]